MAPTPLARNSENFSTSTLDFDVVKGIYFDGRTTRPTEVELSVENGLVRIVGLASPVTLPVDDVDLSPPLGRTPRSLRLPDGGVIELPHGPALEPLESRSSAGLAFVSMLERRWPHAVLALCGLVAASFAFIKAGMPLIAEHAAKRVPHELVASLSSDVMDRLDGLYFRPSRLPDGRRTQLLEAFSEVADDTHMAHRVNLQFRRSLVGPNAFALPSGTVVLTDELIELAHNDEELIGVLAHEIGHVQENHIVRTLLVQTGIGLLLSIATGDVAGAGATVLVPSVLLNSSYSRGFEREADAFALRYLQARGMSGNSIRDLLLRVEEEDGGDNSGDAPKWLDYLSTHPPTDERGE